MKNWFLKTVLPWMKKRCWYIVLLIASSCYVFVYRYDIYELSEFNSMYLIFALWLVLLGLPLFSEIEIGSVKLKKELEQTRTELKEDIGQIRADIKLSNFSNQQVTVNVGMPSETELERQKARANSEGSVSTQANMDFGISDTNLYLAKVRMSLEKQMSALCSTIQLDVRMRTSHEMVRLLTAVGMIGKETAKLILQVVAIANRGIHGEIVDENYVEFVRNTYPAIKRCLDEVENSSADNMELCVCPRCRYRGLSKYANECPNCGYVFCGD